MKIIVTGGTGFIGKYIVSKLSVNHKIIIPARNHSKAPDEWKLNENITLVVFDEDKLADQVMSTAPDAIINLLGIIKENKLQGSTFENVHYKYTQMLVEGARKSNVKKFVQMSALGANKNSESKYASTKARAEEYIQDSGLNYTIFRPSIVFGNGQFLFDELKDKAKFIPFMPTPKGKLQPVHVKDVRDCFIKAIEEDLPENIYELCGNKVITYREFFDFALKHVGHTRFTFDAPDILFKGAAALLKHVPDLPISEDQLLLLQQDNVCSGKNGVVDILGSVRNPFDSKTY